MIKPQISDKPLYVKFSENVELSKNHIDFVPDMPQNFDQIDYYL